MASLIDERLWARRQAQKPQALFSNPPSLSHLNSKSSTLVTRDNVGRFQSTSGLMGPGHMDLDAAWMTIALAKFSREIRVSMAKQMLRL